MDINSIIEEIQTLESGPTTVNNVIELASLYIVKEQLQNGNMPGINGLQAEINDILPAYNKYCEVKRKYQLNEISDDAVIYQLELVLQEIADLVCTIYRGTDMRKERRKIKETIEQLYENHCK